MKGLLAIFYTSVIGLIFGYFGSWAFHKFIKFLRR